MYKTICFKIIFAILLSGLCLAQSNAPALAVDVELAKDSTLEGIMQRERNIAHRPGGGLLAL